MKILIADDNADNLYYLEVMLKAAGHEVMSAHNGREALDHLSGTRCDLIISDILMPGMDGFQLCRECRKREDLDAVPFIFYTATYADEKDRKLGLSIGADAYLIKPMEPDELLSVIARVCAEAAGKREGSLADEEDYLTEHNKRLIRALERDGELEESTRELKRQVAERRQAGSHQGERGAFQDHLRHRERRHLPAGYRYRPHCRHEPRHLRHVRYDRASSRTSADRFLCCFPLHTRGDRGG